MPPQPTRWFSELEGRNRYNLQCAHKEAMWAKGITLSWLFSGLWCENSADKAKTV